MVSIRELADLIIAAKEKLHKLPKFLELEAGSFAVIGDLHGDYLSLKQILEWLEHERPGAAIFLGDYIDRGGASLLVINELFNRLVNEKMNYVLLRGNHEYIYRLPVWPHTLPLELQARLGEGWKTVYGLLLACFAELPLACMLESCLCLHGGFPVIDSRAATLAELRTGCLTEQENVVVQVLYNDFSEMLENIAPSPRGAGYVVGWQPVRQFFRENKISVIFRGHQLFNKPAVKLFGKKIYSIMSCKNVYPEVLKKSAAILVKPGKKFIKIVYF
ncbi:MAG: serine/threonine protein phosphatase [bacterium]|nr:serine/threonine protein phosphatase [bacterium]